jgi:hypothetical protein
MNIDILDEGRTLAQLCAQAMRQPVIVQAGGQPQAVLLSYDDYRRLAGPMSPQAAALTFRETYKDWFAAHNQLVEQHGVFGEDHRPW